MSKLGSQERKKRQNICKMSNPVKKQLDALIDFLDKLETKIKS